MASKTTLESLILAVIVLLYSYMYYLIVKAPEIPQLEETWWGEGEEGQDDASIRPFKIDVTKKVSIIFNSIS